MFSHITKQIEKYNYYDCKFKIDFYTQRHNNA